jgi:hypothetical protein
MKHVFIFFTTPLCGEGLSDQQELDFNGRINLEEVCHSTRNGP